MTQLVHWGREVRGCHEISPPWLSCYVDGCGQEQTPALRRKRESVRLVIHGWFMQPRPFFVGPLSPRVVDSVLSQTLVRLSQEMAAIDVNGYVSTRLKVSATGEVRELR